MDTSRRGFAIWLAFMFLVICALAFGLQAKHAALVQAGLVMAALGISFQIVFGLLGQLSLGHSALFGVGAYTYAYLSLHGVPTLLAVAAACAVGGLTGTAVASITARLGGAYFAVVTYALASVIAVLVSASATLGQTEGLTGVPSVHILDLLRRPQEQLILAGLCFLVVLTGFFALWRSRLGSMLEAVRFDTLLAGSLGIHVALATVFATGISGVFAGLVGAVFAQSSRFVSPDVFHLYYIVTPLAAVAIGGTRKLSGALLGSIVVVIVPLALSMTPIANQIVSGLLLAIFVILFPEGVAGLLRFLVKPKVQGPDSVSRIGLAVTTSQLTSRSDPEHRHIDKLPVLVASGLHVRYGGVHAVNDFSLSIGRGEIVGLIGPNGAGKSSLVNALTGAARASAGQVSINGMDVTALAAYQRARQGLGRTFQNTSVVDSLTVAASLQLACSRGLYRRTIGSRETARLELLLSACGLEGLRESKVGALSYMHRRLTAIAMSLASEPTVVFLDEATAGLTAEERTSIGNLITDIARQWQTSFLVIEHDVEFVAAIADRICVMNEGRFLVDGTPAAVLRDPAVIAAYLGSAWNASEDSLA